MVYSGFFDSATQGAVTHWASWVWFKLRRAHHRAFHDGLAFPHKPIKIRELLIKSTKLCEPYSSFCNFCVIMQPPSLAFFTSLGYGTPFLSFYRQIRPSPILLLRKFTPFLLLSLKTMALLFSLLALLETVWQVLQESKHMISYKPLKPKGRFF